MATFLLGLHEGFKAKELRAGLSNTLERIYHIVLCIVDQSVVGGAESGAQTLVLLTATDIVLALTPLTPLAWEFTIDHSRVRCSCSLLPWSMTSDHIRSLAASVFSNCFLQAQCLCIRGDIMYVFRVPNPLTRSAALNNDKRKLLFLVCDSNVTRSATTGRRLALCQISSAWIRNLAPSHYYSSQRAKVPSSLTMARFILVSMSLKVALYRMFFVLNLFEIF